MAYALAPQNRSGSSIAEQIKNQVVGPIRAEMKAQLDAARLEKQVLQEQLNATSSAPVQRDLQRRMAEVDVRIDKLMSSVDKLDRQLTSRENGGGFATTSPPPQFPTRPDPFDHFNPAPMVISIMAILFIGFPLALTFARLMWRRATHATPPALNIETARRFDRLEQSVDAIAIEIERISENQRYLTRIMAEPKKEGLGTGG